MSKVVDLAVIYWFLKTLTTSWEDQDAFKLGIIDVNGKVIRKEATLITREEKAAYTLFHRLIFNIKKLLEKLPGGKTRLASFALGLFLLREEASNHMTDPKKLEFAFLDHMRQTVPEYAEFLNEQFETMLYEASIDEGAYIYGETGETIVIDSDLAPIDRVLGIPIYKVGDTFFSMNEVRRIS